VKAGQVTLLLRELREGRRDAFDRVVPRGQDTAQRDWMKARAWLREALRERPPER
jgi:hypothetical protein